MTLNTQQPTLYSDLNPVVVDLAEGILDILDNNVVGVYLLGSLTYSDFNSATSDIDLVTVVKQAVSSPHLDPLKAFHATIEARYSRWEKRIEASYMPQYMLTEILPPADPRPYYGEGIFYDQAHYGDEWIINNYLLYQHGIALAGVDFKHLVSPIAIEDVQKACIRDLFREWKPKINDTEWLANQHYRSYIVLNLCRILYTVMCAQALSKKVAASWVKDTYPQWRDLIQAAENWQYGADMGYQPEVNAFIQFAIAEVEKTLIYQDS